jgi:hypothetical protein
MAHRIRKEWRINLQSHLQGGGLLRDHLTARADQKAIRAAEETGTQNFIATGRQQGVKDVRLRGDGQLKVEQPLEAMPPGFEAKAMGTQQNRGGIPVMEGMGYEGAHSVSGLDEELVGEAMK